MPPLAANQTFAGIIAWVIGIINIILPVLLALAVVLLMYSGYRYILKSADAKGKSPEREALFWGLIAIFVIVSVWGILRIMCATLTGSASCNATSSTQTSSQTSSGPQQIFSVPQPGIQINL